MVDQMSIEVADALTRLSGEKHCPKTEQPCRMMCGRRRNKLNMPGSDAFPLRAAHPTQLGTADDRIPHRWVVLVDLASTAWVHLRVHKAEKLLNDIVASGIDPELCTSAVFTQLADALRKITWKS